MKRTNQGIFWAIFLLLAGLFLLLKNLDVFGPWGEVAWGGLFAVTGLGFLISFLVDVKQWWRAIPAFTLLSIGAPILLAWRNISLGYWNNSIVLFGVALAFWAVLLVRRENWWAEIPAGVLTVVGVLLGLQSTLRPDSTQWLVALFLGLGLVFGLLYVLRLGERETWWPAVPSAALILFAIVTLAGPLGETQVLARWWPAALLGAGLLVMLVSVQWLPARQRGTANGKEVIPPAAAIEDYEATPPAQGASVTQVIPEAELPPAPEPIQPEAAPEPEPSQAQGQAQEVSSEQLYDLLRNQQPPEPPANGESK